MSLESILFAVGGLSLSYGILGIYALPRCAYCKRRVFFFQKHPIPSLHHRCLELFCLGYAKGIETAATQAKRIIDDMHSKSSSITH
jgi:hypothetical protein